MNKTTVLCRIHHKKCRQEREETDICNAREQVPDDSTKDWSGRETESIWWWLNQATSVNWRTLLQEHINELFVQICAQKMMNQAKVMNNWTTVFQRKRVVYIWSVVIWWTKLTGPNHRFNSRLRRLTSYRYTIHFFQNHIYGLYLCGFTLNLIQSCYSIFEKHKVWYTFRITVFLILCDDNDLNFEGHEK